MRHIEDASARLRLTGAALASAMLVAACTVPEHMHVTEGSAPQNVDIDVRFRSTYYFRVFDYCWSKEDPPAPLKVGQGPGTNYRRIIPETDTLYRYRMSGKSSALFSDIKFESGTLTQADIDPFGADIVYNPDINGFLVRSPATAEQDARAATSERTAQAARAKALQQFETLSRMYDKVPPSNTDVRAALKTAMDTAMKVYVGGDPAELKTPIERLTAAFENMANKSGPTSTQVKEIAAQVVTEVKKLAAASDTKPGEPCKYGENVAKGFQLMGPEGIKTLNQNERLVMAMFTGAKPLTETLQEYSGRVLRARRNPAEQLLPLAQESLRIVEAQRAVDRAKIQVTDTNMAAGTTAEVFKATRSALEGR